MEHELVVNQAVVRLPEPQVRVKGCGGHHVCRERMVSIGLEHGKYGTKHGMVKTDVVLVKFVLSWCCLRDWVSAASVPPRFT